METHWYNFGNSFCVVVHSLLWLSHCCYLLNASASWLQPVLSLFHWEPHISTLVTLILKIKWYIETILAIWEKVRKAFMESVDFASKSVVLILVMVVVLVVCIVNLPIQIVCSSCLVMLNKRCIKVISSGDSSVISVSRISRVWS